MEKKNAGIQWLRSDKDFYIGAPYGLGIWTLIKEIKMKGAIIGGTGFYEAGDLLRTETVKTPYGTVVVYVIL